MPTSQKKVATQQTPRVRHCNTERSKLQMLLDITRALTVEVTLEKILRLIVDSTTSLLKADRTTLYLMDEEGTELCNYIMQGKDITTIRLRVGQGLAGTVAQTGEIINIPNAYHDPRFDQSWDKISGYQTRTVLVMPMKNQNDRIIGVIQVLNKHRGVFTKTDENWLASLGSSAAVAIEKSQLIEQIQKMFDSFVETLADTLDARDKQTAGHSRRVQKYSEYLALQLGYAKKSLEWRRLSLAAALHDFGKIGVPEAILTKPGALTAEERSLMEDHARITGEILSKMYFPPELRTIPKMAAQHHEWLNGAGYPGKLKADEIMFEAKILSVADVFDALTHKRYYRDPFTYHEAFEFMNKERGTHFDGRVLDALKTLLNDPQLLFLLDEKPRVEAMLRA